MNYMIYNNVFISLKFIHEQRRTAMHSVASQIENKSDRGGTFLIRKKKKKKEVIKMNKEEEGKSKLTRIV